MEVIEMDRNNIEEILKKLGSENIPADVQKIAEDAARDFSEKQTKQPKYYVIWENIMRSRITKLTAAAVIIIAVVFGVRQFFGGTVTFADVIEPILNAKTAVLDIVIGSEEDNVPVIHDMVMGSRIRRTMSNMPEVVSIIDLEKGKILVLTSPAKEATYIDLKGLPSIPNYMDRLINVIRKLQDSPDFSFEELGERDIGGQKLIGFRAANPLLDVTIWADPCTIIPVRIEQTEGQMKVVCKNLHFDTPMDESLFSMDAPEGYTLKQTEIDLMGSTEQDFIEGLRVRAEVFGDGTFPEGVAVEDYLRDAPAIGKKMGELGLSEQEQNELGMKLAKHLLFIRFFKGEGEWHYAGKGVKLGDASKAIFWYQPKDSQTYRVIYGDLHIEDTAPDNLLK
jgi:hypothetical protein